MPWPPPILSNQLTLSQPGWADYAHHSTKCPPGFSDLATALAANHGRLVQNPFWGHLICSWLLSKNFFGEEVGIILFLVFFLNIKDNFCLVFLVFRAEIWRKNVCVVNVPFTNTTSKKSLKVSLCRSVFKAYFSEALRTNVKRKWKFYLPRKKKASSFLPTTKPIDLDLYHHSMMYAYLGWSLCTVCWVCTYKNTKQSTIYNICIPLLHIVILIQSIFHYAKI